MATQPDFDACASWQEIAAKPSRYSIPAIFDQIQRPRLDRMDSKGQRKPSTTIKRQASQDPIHAHLVTLLLDADAVIIVRVDQVEARVPWSLAVEVRLVLDLISVDLFDSHVVSLGSMDCDQRRKDCHMQVSDRQCLATKLSLLPLGPMATSLRDVELFMSSLLNDKTRPWQREHALLPLPWRKVESLLNSKPGKPLIVGVMMQDNVVRPTTPIRRALSHWVDKLQQSTSANRARIELRRWDPLDMHRRAWHLIRSLYFIDSGKLFHLVAKSTGEPLLPLTQYILSQPFVPSATANLEADSSNNTASPKLEEMSVTQLWAAVRAREAFPKEFFKRWNELQLDCLLSPVQGNVAPRPGTIKYWGYTSVFNLVDYPGLVFPSGFKADARRDEEYEEKERSLQAEFGHTSKKQGEWLSDFDKDNMQEYQQHRAVFDNAPVGLQLIGRRYKDEELIKYAELLQHLVSTHKYISQGSCPILASFLLPIALSSTSSLQT
ncbi:hypothetical protein NDA17_000052 [Ustilago hordei]|nr:hypothetical protein NDA17_000052 [Ustilago hordei]